MSSGRRAISSAAKFFAFFLKNQLAFLLIFYTVSSLQINFSLKFQFFWFFIMNF